MDLNLLWFILLVVLLTGYAILDGFDLGVGIVHLFVKGDRNRRLALNSIGPLWDGNEVWLVTFGGALFAAFPDAYKSIFSGFYTAFMLVLFGLIFRAVSIEFRSKQESKAWRAAWDFGFAFASFLATFVFGVAVGNSMIGVPVDDNRDIVISFFALLNPYSVMVGVFAVSMFAMHGTLYLYLKTEGELQERIHGWMWRTFGLFLVLFVLLTIWTLTEVPRATENFKTYPIMWVVVVLNVLAIANIPRAIYKNRAGYAFASSCCTIAAFVFLFAAALFPHLVANTDPTKESLNIYNAASSQKTLGIMALIALIGMPCVLTYTAIVYWTFRGKVQLGEHSY